AHPDAPNPANAPADIVQPAGGTRHGLQ
ncbi:MAG TPA: RNA polymerase subunit sigma, partial [Cupriavidus sp.]|nr:RNA polymerase subunit sigma [Cupriavidus sp.]